MPDMTLLKFQIDQAKDKVRRLEEEFEKAKEKGFVVPRYKC